MKYLTILLVLISQLSYAQSTSLDKIISDIDIQQDTVMSVYNWITDNIKYDVSKMESMTERRRPSKSGSKTEAEHKQQLLDKVISKKKGVCEDYALLFHEIMTDLGYQSIVVEGMSRNQKGNVQKRIGHAWNALKVDGEWKLYDLTWGAGHINDRKKFVKKYSTEWYEVDPNEMRKSHLPFDPMWQLSAAPINYKQFEDGTDVSDVENKMDYTALIDTHFSSDEKTQILAQIERSKTIGDDIKLLSKWQKYMQQKADLYDIFSQPDIIQAASDNCNAATDLYNECQKKGRAKNYEGKKWNPDYSKSKMIEAKSKLESAISSLESLSIDDSKAKRKISRFVTQAERLLKRVDTEIDYIDKLVKR